MTSIDNDNELGEDSIVKLQSSINTKENPNSSLKIYKSRKIHEPVNARMAFWAVYVFFFRYHR